MTYYTSPILSDWQRQIIVGTILGGSSLVKPPKGRNCYLFMRSSDKEWIEYKAEELKCLSSQRPFTLEGNTLRWHSNCYPLFNELRNIFYDKETKFITEHILDEVCMKDIGLATWFGDCGKVKKDRIWLNTHKFGENGTNAICNWFNSAMLEAEVAKERDSYRVVLTRKGTQKFLATVAHTMPDFMCKRLD